MKREIFVVCINGKLYLENAHYSFLPTTTENIMSAHFFLKREDAEKQAKKANGEVVDLFLTDGDDSEEVRELTEKVEKLEAENKILIKNFRKLLGKDEEET